MTCFHFHAVAARALLLLGLALGDAVCRGPRPQRVVQEYRFDEGRNAENVGKSWHRTAEGAVVFFNEGGFPAISLEKFRAPSEGRYRFLINGYAYQSLKPITYAAYSGSFGRNADSRLLGHFVAQPASSVTIEFETFLFRGESIPLFPRGLTNPSGDLRRDGPAGYKGPGLAMHSVTIDGPILSDWPGRGHRLMFGKLLAVDVGPVANRHKPWYRPVLEARQARMFGRRKPRQGGGMPVGASNGTHVKGWNEA